MAKRTALIALAAIAILAWALNLKAASDGTVAYPLGYSDWAKVKSQLVDPQSPAAGRYGGLHHNLCK